MSAFEQNNDISVKKECIELLTVCKNENTENCLYSFLKSKMLMNFPKLPGNHKDGGLRTPGHIQPAWQFLLHSSPMTRHF